MRKKIIKAMQITITLNNVVPSRPMQSTYKNYVENCSAPSQLSYILRTIFGDMSKNSNMPFDVQSFFICNVSN